MEPVRILYVVIPHLFARLPEADVLAHRIVVRVFTRISRISALDQKVFMSMFCPRHYVTP
jgi:hypothetical protein